MKEKIAGRVDGCERSSRLLSFRVPCTNSNKCPVAIDVAPAWPLPQFRRYLSEGLVMYGGRWRRESCPACQDPNRRVAALDDDTRNFAEMLVGKGLAAAQASRARASSFLPRLLKLRVVFVASCQQPHRAPSNLSPPNFVPARLHKSRRAACPRSPLRLRFSVSP